MAYRRPPLPRHEDRRTQALVQAHFDTLNQDRLRHDAERDIGRDPSGRTEVTIAAGSTEVIYHHLGHQPTGWRVVDQSTAADQPLQRTAWDDSSVTLQNNGSTDFTGTIEVY